MNQFRSRSYKLRTRKDDFFDLWETNDNERFGVSAILTRESISQDHDSSWIPEGKLIWVEFIGVN